MKTKQFKELKEKIVEAVKALPQQIWDKLKELGTIIADALKNILPKFIKDFTSLSSIIQKRGISVVNLNLDSNWKFFPREDIRSIL